MNEPTLLQLLYRLWKKINDRRRLQFGLLFLFMIVASFAEVLSIGALLPFLATLTDPERIYGHPYAQPLIQFLKLTNPDQLLFPFTIIFALGALLSGTIRFLQLVILTRLSHSVGADLSFEMYKRTLYQPYSVHVARNSSEVIAGISTKANALVYAVIMPVLNVISSSMMMLFIVLTLMLIEPFIAFSAFCGFGVIYLLVGLLAKNPLKRSSIQQNYYMNRMFKALQEGLGGIRDVLIDGTQEAYGKVYRSADLPLRRAQAIIAIVGNGPRFGVEALGMILIALLAYSLSDSPEGFAGALPVLGALALGAQRLLPIMQIFYGSWSSVHGAQAGIAQSLELLEQPLPELLEHTSVTFERSINLKNLAFRYTKESPWILKGGLNLTISKGSFTGLIGPTGSGKSTLLDVFMGLLTPTSGNIEVDGIRINEENLPSWLTSIAHVPQAIFLSDASIAENIAFGVEKHEIDHNRVRDAARRAQIADSIESWHDEYDTEVGERGIRLSGGQRQRLGIARALYKQASVIVFDEATSALDSATESAVMREIEMLDDQPTIIIVAHRLTTLKNCSQIVELIDGEISRIGSYENIIGTD